MKKRIMTLTMTAMMTMLMPTSMAGSDVLTNLSYLQRFGYAFRTTIFDNEALRFYSGEPSMSMLSVSFTSSPSSSDRLPQLGDGGRKWTMSAQSFQHLSANDYVWGQATYDNGRRYDVRWNETSDFLLVYPYVMADGRGGDLKYEQYALNGGYARRLHQWHLGFSLGYRALSEYRQNDPRPNNTVADLSGSFSLGYATGTHAIAASVKAGKYKQTNELVYFNDLGAQMEYHLTGLGNDFARFSGNNNNTFYKGYRIGGSIGTTPISGKGLSGGISYQYMDLEKIISDLNRLPLNHIGEHTWRGEIAWQQAIYGVKVCGEYATRTGRDNIFGDASGNVYPKIGTREMYDSNHTYVNLTGFYEPESVNKLSWGVSPQVSYTSFHSTHADSGNRFDTSHIHYGLAANGSWMQGKNRVGLTVSAEHRAHLDSKLHLYDTTTPELETTLLGIYQYMHDGETRLSVSTRFDHAIKESMAIYVKAAWEHDFFSKNHHSNEMSVTMGITL